VAEAEPKRILVIDDESGVRRLLTDLLAGEGYDVSEASDGIRGLERLRDVSPDLIILDLMMPVVSGWAFAEKCRLMDISGDVPIIAMSAMFDLNAAAATLDVLGVRMLRSRSMSRRYLHWWRSSSSGPPRPRISGMLLTW